MFTLRGEISLPIRLLPTIRFSTAAKILEFDNIFKISRFAVTFLMGCLLPGDETALIDQESLFSNSKLPMRNVIAKSEILNILSNSRVFAAVEKRMVTSTRIGGDISPRRVNVWCQKLVRVFRICCILSS